MIMRAAGHPSRLTLDPSDEDFALAVSGWGLYLSGLSRTWSRSKQFRAALEPQRPHRPQVTGSPIATAANQVQLFRRLHQFSFLTIRPLPDLHIVFSGRDPRDINVR